MFEEKATKFEFYWTDERELVYLTNKQKMLFKYFFNVKLLDSTIIGKPY